MATSLLQALRQGCPSQGSVSWELTEKNGGDQRSGREFPAWGLFVHTRANPQCLDLRVYPILLGLNTWVARFNYDLALKQAPVDFLIAVIQIGVSNPTTISFLNGHLVKDFIQHT